jgi:hypothetical protein
MPDPTWSASLKAIAENIAAANRDYLDAMVRLRDLPLVHDTRAQRAKTIREALHAAILVNRAMMTGVLIQEHLFGPDGRPVQADDPEAARLAAMEEMAAILVWVLFPMLGDDHYACAALHADIQRWREGAQSEIYRPVGYRNPASPDAVRRADREVAVLLFKLTASARGIAEAKLLQQIPGAPSYATFRTTWQQEVGKASRDLMVRCGQHHRTAPPDTAFSWPLPAGYRLTIAEAQALRAFEDGELTLEKLFALVQGTGPYEGLGRRHERGKHR